MYFRDCDGYNIWNKRAFHFNCKNTCEHRVVKLTNNEVILYYSICYYNYDLFKYIIDNYLSKNELKIDVHLIKLAIHIFCKTKKNNR